MQKSCFSYPVEFVEDVFGESSVLADLLKKITGSDSPKALIVADVNVVQHTEGLGTKIGRYVQQHGVRLAGSPVVLAGGEKVKADNFQSALKVVSALLSAKLGKNDVVLAIGGGTILDVAGYAAAQVRGGVKLVRIPTTPAAMIDGAYADFAAVDSATVKDALRIPSLPAAVVVDVSFARSVLDGVWRAGLGEAVRLSVAADATLLKKIAKLAPAYCQRDFDALRALVESAFAVRAKKGPSALSLWVASRLEAMSGYKLPHGYAVPIALCLDLNYAVERGLTKAKDRDAVIEVLKSSGTLDGFAHSAYLLSQEDNLLLGLDAWMLSTGLTMLPFPKGIGKTVQEEPDREVFRSVFKSFASVPAES